ncbi:MAG: hypothetical protein CL578_08145 [Alteromonadaceae bacterium]|nr:hypothetical protein [Alteromonadaceae bacterium]|tara:strand:- start:14488 stop:14670 length:183 start_codon:yes stop_codon:yes gene_type:complete
MFFGIKLSQQSKALYHGGMTKLVTSVSLLEQCKFALLFFEYKMFSDVQQRKIKQSGKLTL